MASTLDMRAVLIAAAIGFVGGIVLNFILAIPSALIPFCGCLVILIYPITGALYPVFARGGGAGPGAGSAALGGAIASVINALISVLCAFAVVALVLGLAGGAAFLSEAGIDSDALTGLLAGGVATIAIVLGISVGLLVVAAGMGAAGGAIYVSVTGSSSSGYGRLG